MHLDHGREGTARPSAGTTAPRAARRRPAVFDVARLDLAARLDRHLARHASSCVCRRDISA